MLSESAVAMVLGLLSRPASASAEPVLCLVVWVFPQDFPVTLAAFNVSTVVELLCTHARSHVGFCGACAE